MKLPNHELAIVPEAKIVRYLLDLSHPVGRSKAVFFLRFGFTLDAWDMMALSLLAHAAEFNVASVEMTSAGHRYAVEGVIHTPDRRDPYVRSIWFVETDQEIPRFVTAYPVDARSK